MAYFLNPFAEEFRGNLNVADRGHAISFVIRPNNGRTVDIVFSHANPAPSTTFDLSGSDGNGGDKSVLTLSICVDAKRYNDLSVDIAGTTASATTVSEIVALLNADPMFASYFEAAPEFLQKYDRFPLRVSIKCKKQLTKFYVKNTGAESVLKFNAKAGVAELPEYFERHAIGNESYPDGETSNSLIILSKRIISNTVASPSVVTSYTHGLTSGNIITIAGSNSDTDIDGDQTVTVIDADTFSVPINVSSDPGTAGFWARKIDAGIISSAVDINGKALGFTLAAAQKDYQLLKGRSGLFIFKKITVDGSDRPTQIIEYHAGSVAGDFARIIKYTYTSTNKNPDTITEEPYILLSGDLISP